MSGAGAHRVAAAGGGPVPVALVTVSDTRTEATDENGRYLRAAVADAGHRVVASRAVPDEPEPIARTLDELVAGDARVVLFNGGTGIAARDRTFDVIAGRLQKTLPGFGELFRMLSHRQVGAAAMLSRAVAGVLDGTVVISLPGSPAAVRLGWEELIRPELEHLAWELTR